MIRKKEEGRFLQFDGFTADNFVMIEIAVKVVANVLAFFRHDFNVFRSKGELCLTRRVIWTRH
jgi:hypothetical protein